MPRPHHATVVSYLALFVALSGGAYAIGTLPPRSVGTPQLKPCAVCALDRVPRAVGEVRDAIVVVAEI
jgi:hypothetical protein